MPPDKGKKQNEFFNLNFNRGYSLDYKIKFKLEIEQNDTLPYLYALLIKTHKVIERTVYK